MPFVKFGVYIPTGQTKQRTVFIQESQVEIEEFTDTWRAHHPYLITSSFITTTIFFFLPSFIQSFIHSFIHSSKILIQHHPRSHVSSLIPQPPQPPIPFIQQKARSPDTPRVATIVPDNEISSLNWSFEDGDGSFSWKNSATAKQGFYFSAFWGYDIEN